MRIFLRWLIRLVIDLIARVEIQGFENIPKEGSFVIATNHLGRLDVALLFYALEGDFILPVAEKYEHHWLFGPIGNAMGGIWLDRFNADVRSIREILARMKAGGVLVIAPEGTRTYSEYWKTGFYYMAHRSSVPLVLAGADYPKKEIHVSAPLHPTGDIGADMEKIAAFYEPLTGRNPKEASPIKLAPPRPAKE